MFFSFKMKSFQVSPCKNNLFSTSFNYISFLFSFFQNGLPSPENPYVFNGDFVDRGKKGLEVLLLLLSCLLVFPGGVFLNRGNHEDTVMNARYGFIREVHQKYKVKHFPCNFQINDMACCFLIRKIYRVHSNQYCLTCKLDDNRRLQKLYTIKVYQNNNSEFSLQHNAERLLKLIEEVYRWLPLGTIVNNRVLVVHGGISDSTDLDLIKSLDRGKVSFTFY